MGRLVLIIAGAIIALASIVLISYLASIALATFSVLVILLVLIGMIAILNKIGEGMTVKVVPPVLYTVVGLVTIFFSISI